MANWDKWISGLIGRDRDTHPITEHFFEAPEDFEDELPDGPESEFLDGIFLGIYYRDAAGARSSRTITAQDLVVDNQRVFLRGICHLRNAFRTFRCDRIEEIYSADGEVFSPVDFWRIIGVSDAIIEKMRPSILDAPSQNTGSIRRKSWHSSAAVVAEGPGLRQRRLVRHQIRILAALSRSDGNMYPQEVEEIIEYICVECDNAEVPFSEEDLNALRQYVKRLRPTGEKVLESLEALFSIGQGFGQSDLRRLRRAMKAVVDADGVIHESEFDFLNGFEAEVMNRN